MKVLVCGPRDWVEQKPVEDILRRLPEGTTIIHGGQRGIDMIAGFVAEDVLGLPVRSYPVDHRLDGPWPAAGPRRNMRMLADESPYKGDGTYIDLGLAFKRQEELTRGTKSMTGLMRDGDIPVVEILWQKDSWDKYLESLDLIGK